MNFDMKTPCAECPFRNDRPAYLRVARAVGIINSITVKDQTFGCHKFTAVGRGKRTLRRDWQMCAGAAIFLENIGWRNQLLQIAERWGLRDPKRLDLGAPVYKTREEFLEACRLSCR